MTVNTGLTCAPCVTDLALVREAVTSVAGTACCQAHAVLLTYSSDNPGRRRARVEQLRDLAEAKMEMASETEKAALELLVAEYALIAVMDMGGNRDAQPGQQRRDAQRDGNREPRAPRTGQPREQREPRAEGDAPRVEGEGRGRRGRRGRPERAAGETVEQTTHVTVTSAPTTEPTAPAAPAAAPTDSSAPAAPAAPAAPSSDAPVSAAPAAAPAPSSDAPASAPVAAPAAPSEA